MEVQHIDLPRKDARHLFQDGHLISHNTDNFARVKGSCPGCAFNGKPNGHMCNAAPCGLRHRYVQVG